MIARFGWMSTSSTTTIGSAPSSETLATCPAGKGSGRSFSANHSNGQHVEDWRCWSWRCRFWRWKFIKHSMDFVCLVNIFKEMTLPLNEINYIFPGTSTPSSRSYLFLGSPLPLEISRTPGKHTIFINFEMGNDDLRRTIWMKRLGSQFEICYLWICSWYDWFND